ncbi:MAG: anthranilate synthase component I [Candidatus Xenobiia bacterium LiM19]
MYIKYFPARKEFREMAARGNLVPVCLQFLADTDTPVSVIAKLRGSSGTSFLLESVEGGDRWARYSFLGNSSKKTIKVYSDTLEVEDASGTSTVNHSGDPLPPLRDLMAEYRPVSHPDLPRFWGGAIGYITYEFSSFFEKIPHQLPEKAVLACFIITDNLIIFDNISHTMTLVAHAFIQNGDNLDEVYDNSLRRLDEMMSQIRKPLEESEEPHHPTCQLAPVVPVNDFCSSIRKVKEYILEGDIIQAVISHPFICSNPPDPWLLYRAQRYVNPSPYLYFMEIGKEVLVGSSPETMVRLEGGSAVLRPIAGTRKRGATEQEDRRLADDLLQDQKERAEHLMLVDLGRNDLGRIAETGTVQVTDLMVVERYSHVMHLVSNINCELKREYDAWDLLRAVFPAGTLSGAPKIRAMEIIQETEKKPRGPYGGAVGYISFTGNMDLAITIRTAWLHNGTMTVQAGAGIVADSDPEKEYQETVNKAMAMQKALELINQGSGLKKP